MFEWRLACDQALAQQWFWKSGVRCLHAECSVCTIPHIDTSLAMENTLQVRSFYLPFVFALVSLVSGGMPAAMQDLIGIGAGHIYYFFKDVFPVQSGRLVPVHGNPVRC
jgi:hypothetical protein